MNNDFEFEIFNNDLLDNKKEKHLNFAGDPVTAGIEALGKGLEMGGKIAEASAKKKEAEAKIIEIGGKRQAQAKDCETSKEFKKFLDPKYRKTRIAGCKEIVNKRLDAEEEEQKQIVRRMTALEENKIVSDLDTKKSTIEEKKTSKKMYAIAGVVSLIFILGTIIYIKSKSK